MKINVLDQTGKKSKEIETGIFSGKIREDIVQKIVEVEKIPQEWAPSELAGNQTSASGNVRHLRHMWKSDRGKGMARVPKKRMSRRGDRFQWVAAVVPSARGGRRAHGPKVGGRIGKINTKEMILGFKSALAIDSNAEMIKKKYSRLADYDKTFSLPLIIESKSLNLKTKEFITLLKLVLGELSIVSFQEKTIRAGIGKMRGRKYKKNAGMLLVIGKEEKKKVNGIDIVDVKKLRVTDLASNGARICVFTEQAVKDLENKLEAKSK